MVDCAVSQLSAVVFPPGPQSSYRTGCDWFSKETERNNSSRSLYRMREVHLQETVWEEASESAFSENIFKKLSAASIKSNFSFFL